MTHRRRAGFTLIELLIVVVIIGILAAIAIPKFSATRNKAAQAALKSDLRNLMTAQESYFGDYAQYGADASAFTTGANLWAPSGGVTAVIAGNTTGYGATVTSGPVSCSVSYVATSTATTNGVPACQ
ncbi:MAG: hypothetical protein RL139_1000 [Gemmatimonadota bacterium]|jgi:type IV pilus assembly protein PilA